MLDTIEIHVQPASTIPRKTRKNVHLITQAISELEIEHDLHQMRYLGKRGKETSGEIIFHARASPESAEWLYEAVSRQIERTRACPFEGFRRRIAKPLQGPLTRNLQALVDMDDYMSLDFKPYIPYPQGTISNPEALPQKWDAEIRIIPTEKWWRRTPDEIYIGVTEN